MFNKLKSDYNKYMQIELGCEKTSLKKVLFAIIFAYGFHSMVIYRFGNYIEENIRPKNLLAYYPLIFIYFFFSWLTKKMYGIQINKKAKIGPGLYIGHFGGIHIAPSIIGANCSIHQNSIIGTENVKDAKVPVIGNNVWIGSYSNITESVVVADYATISSGTVVKKNISEKSLVMGNPGRIVQYKYDNSDLL